MLLGEKCSNCSNELWGVPLILPHKNKALFKPSLGSSHRSTFKTVGLH